MQIQKHIPRYPLSDFIQHIVYVSGSLPVPYLKELPDGGINLVIELNESTVNTVYPEKGFQKKYEMKRAWISGIQKQAVVYKNNTDSTIISVRFTAGGFFCLTKIPVTAIGHVGTEAEAILGRSFRDMYQKLLDTAAVAQMFTLIEDYFLSYPVNDSVEHNVVRFIDQNIHKPIEWLIYKSGYSQKHVIHLLKKHTGFSPKYLQRINRFRQVVNEIQNQKDKIDWFSVTHRYGYYDQAHLVREFSHFTGINPTAYLKTQLEMAENHLVSDMILQPPADKPDRK